MLNSRSRTAAGIATRRAAALAGAVVCGLSGAHNLRGDSALDVLWEYEGDRGPVQWGSLDQAFSTCADGSEQSPIDLAKAAEGDFPAVEFDYGPRLATVVNTGHTIQVSVDRGGGITLGGTRYDLLQFHFHHGSEHTLGGVRLPMELHLVHRSARGALAVVGACCSAKAPPTKRWRLSGSAFRAGPTGPRRSPTRSRWRHCCPPPERPGAIADRSPRRRGTEGVSWIVMTEPVTLSAEQIAAFGALYPHNFRPVQPLGRRTLGRDRGTRDE